VFPAEIPLLLLPSLSRVLDKVYEASIWNPLPSCLFILASKPLYEEEPSDSTTSSTSGSTPSTGTRWPMFASVFEVAPRIGFAGEAESAWFKERVLRRCVP
jgi:hypothetical protein